MVVLNYKFVYEYTRSLNIVLSKLYNYVLNKELLKNYKLYTM